MSIKIIINNKLSKKFSQLMGTIFLSIISFVAILSLLFGLMLVLVSARNLTLLRFNLNLNYILYFIIGVYISYESIKNYIKFYQNAVKNPYYILNNFF